VSGGLLAVLPVITHTHADICVKSILAGRSAAALHPDELLIVDNTARGTAKRYRLRTYRDPDGHNLGVARSWNIGAREVLDRELDYLVLISASMRFGPTLHTTWREQMDLNWGAVIIEASGHSWHLIAIHRRVFETIGLFDENFYPAYFEAIDFGYRMRLVDLEGYWPRVWVNALSQGAALHNQVVSCPSDPLLAYYAKKWGGAKGKERYDLPFNGRPLDWWPEATVPELAARYRLVDWW